MMMMMMTDCGCVRVYADAYPMDTHVYPINTWSITRRTPDAYNTESENTWLIQTAFFRMHSDTRLSALSSLELLHIIEALLQLLSHVLFQLLLLRDLLPECNSFTQLLLGLVYGSHSRIHRSC